MKRVALLVLFLAALAPGCMPHAVREDPRKTAQAPTPPPVVDDNVNENNAPEMAKALRAELERELRPAPTAKP
jgi:hypothetical protein